MSEKEVIKRTERLRRDGVIRHLGAQFDSRALGYRSCLVAARVRPEHIDEAAAVINAHPGVTQNYRRNNEFNLWFTIFVSSQSKLGLERTIEVLGASAECDAVRPLPTLTLYKTSGSDGESYSEPGAHNDLTPLTSAEIECVRLLQREIPLQPRPFDVLTRGTTVAPEELLTTARALQKRGQIRRFCVAVNTRKSGFAATAMGVWVVPEERCDEFGAKLSQHKAVSHCYRRPTYDDWPYNLYTTVHARSVDECESIINDLAIDNGLEQKQTLFPTKEYKKARLQFFSRDLDAWEDGHDATRAAAVG